MDDDITIYRTFLERTHCLNANNSSSNLQNEFIGIPSQLNRLFNIYHDSPEYTSKQIKSLKGFQNRLISIVSSNAPFRNMIEFHRGDIQSKSCINHHSTFEEQKWVSPTEEDSYNIHNIHNPTLSKVLKAALVIVREHLTVAIDNGVVAKKLFNIIEESVMELPKANRCISMNTLFLSDVGEIQSFLYSLLSTDTDVHTILELILLMYTKLGGLDRLLEWIDSATDHIQKNDVVVRVDILYIVLQSFLIGDFGMTDEIMGHINDCIGIDISSKDVVSLKEAIDIILISVLRLCEIEQNFDGKPKQIKQDLDPNQFSDIYIWVFGQDIDCIKSAFPDSLSTRLNSSSEKPYTEQVFCTQTKVIMVNNFGQVRSRSILKPSTKDQCFKKTLSKCWSPIQFPDLNIKIDYLCVGFTSVNEKQHILALSKSGQIFSWGGGQHGKLGHGNLDDVKYPKLIDSLRGYVVKQISVGLNHSAAVTETGLSFIWGDGLSFNNVDGEDCLVPKRLKQGIMSNIICGPKCTFMVCINKRDITYIGASCSEYVCYNDHFRLPIHPSPIKWEQFTVGRKLLDSNFGKIKKVVANSNGLLVLLNNGRLYSVGHGLVLGCHNCQIHQSFERVKAMLTVHVLDIALSETHVIVLAKDVIYSWSITISTLIIIEQSLLHFVTNVSTNTLVEDNLQVVAAWSKKEDSKNLLLTAKQSNPYLQSTSVFSTLRSIKNILNKCTKDYQSLPSFEGMVQNSLELLVYCMKNDQFKEICVGPSVFPEAVELMQILLGIYDTLKLNNRVTEVVRDTIIVSSKVFFRCLVDRANYISKLVSSVQSISSLSNGQQLLLETLLLSFNEKSTLNQFTRLNELNIIILDDLLIIICRTLASDVIGFVNENLNAKGSSIDSDEPIASLVKTLNHFATFGYRNYLRRVQNLQTIVHNPVNNLCSLLPMVNSVFGCLKSYLYRIKSTHQMKQWILTSNAMSVQYLFSHTPVGWILFDVLFFLLEEEHYDDVYSLIPHICSTIIVLNDINTILPNTMVSDSQENGFPLYGFRSSNSPPSLPETDTCWSWVFDLQRLAGLLYGKLLTKIMKSVELKDSERIIYWLNTPLFNHIAQLDQRRKATDLIQYRYDEDYERNLNVLLFTDYGKYHLWKKNNILYFTGLQIYSTIIDLITSKLSDVKFEIIVKWHGVSYILEKIINSVNCVIWKIIGKDLYSVNSSLSENLEASINLYTFVVNEKCRCLRNLVQESVKIYQSKRSTSNYIEKPDCHDRVMDALDLASNISIPINCVPRISSIELNQDLYSGVDHITDRESWWWLNSIYSTLNDFFTTDHPMAIELELPMIQYHLLAKKTRYSRAIATVQGIAKLFDTSVKLMDSVFVQIINGMLESSMIVQPVKQFSDEQLLILEAIFRVGLEKLNSCTRIISYSAIPRRLCASILCFISKYNFMQDHFIKIMVEENVFGQIVTLASNHPFITTDKWLIVEGNGDNNLFNVFNIIAWCTVEDLMLNLSIHNISISEDVKKQLENQIISVVDDIYQQINDNVFRNIFDLYTLLNLSRILYLKTDFFHKDLHRVQWSDVLLNIATIKTEDDSFNVFYSKYAIQITAIDFLTAIVSDLNDIDISWRNFFETTIHRFADYYYYLFETAPKLQTKSVINAIECRLKSFNDERSNDDQTPSCVCIYGNGNFDRDRTYHCDVVSSDTILISSKGMEQYLAMTQEIMCSGVWQVIIDISCSDNIVEFSCGFMMYDQYPWPTDYQSLINLKKVIQPISISGQKSLSHRMECVIDIDQCIAYFFNVYNRVQRFTAKESLYRFFLSFSQNSVYKSSPYEVHIVSVKQTTHSVIHDFNNFYNNSGICHNDYIVRSRLYGVVTKLCDKMPDLLFTLIIQPLSEQLKFCFHLDLYSDKKLTDPTSSVSLLFSLFLLCEFPKHHRFYRGEMCTYLSHNDGSEHLGIIINFTTKLKSKFVGLTFVDKVADCSEILCTIHSMSTNSQINIPMKNLIKDEIYQETILAKYFKMVFPDHVEDIVSLLSNLSKCVSLKFFNIDVTNYDGLPWCSDPSTVNSAEYYFIKCLLSNLFLKIFGFDDFLEYFTIERNEKVEKKFHSIFQIIIKLALKPSPMKNISETNDFICCSLRLIEGFKVIQSEIDLGIAKKYAKLYLQSHLGTFLSKNERKILIDALKRAGFTKELIDSFANHPIEQLSSGGSVTFSLRRRLLDCSVTSDQLDAMAINHTPANEYDASSQASDQVHELDQIVTYGAYYNVNATQRQRLIHDFFTIQASKNKVSRTCPICDLVLKSDVESLFSHLSSKHSHNCRKTFQHQASKGIDADGHCHDIDIDTLHCATITDKLYCVCNDYLTKIILTKNVCVDYETFFNEHYQTNPLIGWAGTLSSEHYFFQKMSEVQIYLPIKRPEVEEVNIIGDNIVKEINISKIIFDHKEKEDLSNIVKNVSDDVPFVCQMNSCAIIKALVRLECTEQVLSSRRIICQLVKLIYKRESKKDVYVMMQRYMFNDFAFVCHMIRLVEFERMKLEESVTKDIQTINFGKEDFLSILIMTFEKCLDTSDKIHNFLRSFLLILENHLTSTSEYFRLNRDSDKTILVCPSRLLTQVLCNSSIRVLDSIMSSNITYGYWKNDLEEMIELMAFGVVNDICSVTDKIWCLYNITRLFQVFQKWKMNTGNNNINQADIYDDLSTDYSQVVHLTNGNVKKLIPANNGHCVLTADHEGTLRIWDIDSNIGFQQHLLQTLLFSFGEVDTSDNRDFSFIDDSSALATGALRSDIGDYLTMVGVQHVAVSFNGLYIAESIGVYLNIWSTKSVYSQPQLIRLSYNVTALIFPELTFDGIHGAPADQLLVGLSNGRLLLMRIFDNGTRITQKILKTGIEDNISISVLAWNKERNPIAIGYDDGSIVLTDQRIDAEHSLLETIHSSRISQLIYNPYCSTFGKILLASSSVDDHRIAIWNDVKIVCVISLSEPVTCIEWLSRKFIYDDDMFIIICGTSHGLVQLWQFHESGNGVQNILSICGHVSGIVVLRMCDNTGLLTTGCQSGLVNIWCVKDRSLISTFRGNEAVIGAEWTLNGNLAVVWSNSQYVDIWQYFNDVAFQKNGLRQWALIRKIFVEDSDSRHIKHLDNLKKLVSSINKMIIQQYNSEDSFVKCGYSITYSQYLQALIRFVFSLNLLPSFIPCVKSFYLDISPLRTSTIQRELQRENIFQRRTMCHILNRNCNLSRFNDNCMEGLFDLDELIRITKDICLESNQSSDIIPKWWWDWCFESESFVHNYLDAKWDNRYWSWDMQIELNEWYKCSPEEWIAQYKSSTYIWGCGKRGELNMISKKDWERPLELKIDGIQQVVCGNALTLLITGDGTLMACGEGLEIVFNPYLREESSRMIIVPILLDFKITHVAVSRGPESHIIAITSFGDVYSWGIGSHGKLGHGHGTSLKKPKLIEGLKGKCSIQADCGHMHSAIVTASGRLYTFGLGASGQLGVEILLGSDTPRLVDFDDEDVKIGYVACGSTHTLAIGQDGMSLYAFGEGAFGKLGLGDLNNRFSPVRVNLNKMTLLKVSCGINFSAALTDKGDVFVWGHSDYLGLSECNYDMSNKTEGTHATKPIINHNLANEGVTIIDISAGNDVMFALTTTGLIYGWGSNNNNLLLSAIKTHVYIPELIVLNKKLNFKQISCGRHHVCTSSHSPHSYRYDIPTGPQLIHNSSDDIDKSSYPSLAASNLNRVDLTARLVVILYWNELIRLTWQLWLPLTNQAYSLSDHRDDPVLSDSDWPLIAPQSYLLRECNWTLAPFDFFRTNRLRSLINNENLLSAIYRYISGSMITNRTYASLVKINRIEKVEHVFVQTCHQVLKMHPMELRLPWRAWKVKLVNEGADDAGGAYDETISEMCTELQSPDLELDVLIQSPSDSTVYLPNPNSKVCPDYFRFLGILMGAAIRTKKPIDLNLDPLFWKLMVKSSITVEDLRRLDPAYFNSLTSINDPNEYDECYLKEVLSIENFVVFSANRNENEMIYKGCERYVNRTNIVSFVQHAIAFRLHEFDLCVAHIRDGFAGVSPILFLDIMTWDQLERAVCGSRTISVSVLKSITRYVDVDENNEIFSWFWDVLENFSEAEKSLFLRFVTGKSRLPCENTKIPFRLFIYLSKLPLTSLPQAQTCFNQLRLPKYGSRAELELRLKIAISQCRSIDMDDYMLARNREA